MAKTKLDIVGKAKKVPRIKRTRAKAFNPTLGSIQEEVSDSPGELRKRYSPYSIPKKAEGAKKIYKTIGNFDIDLHQLTLLVTNTPYTCYGDEYKHIYKFKLSQDVQFSDSLVCFTQNQLNSPENMMKVLCMDIPAFLHIFSCFTTKMFAKMAEDAMLLADEWTKDNGPKEMKGRRRADERQTFLDYRENSKYRGVSEIILAATTYNFNLANQDVDEDLTCRPDDIVFQLRYQIPKEQSEDGHSIVKPGMLILSLKDWKQLVQHKEFINIYEEVWNFWPLPQSYSTRLEKYCKVNIEDTDKHDGGDS